MTEIRPDISVSKNLLEQIRQRAQDGAISKEDLTELRATASNDSAGLDSNEENLLNSFDEEFNSKANIEKNVQSFKNVAAHDSTANEVDFTKVEVKSENRGLWSSVTSGFGLFGRSSTTSGVRVSEGNIPVTNNPQTLSTMTERRETEVQNFKDMLGPLEKELQGNSDELHTRLAAELGIDPAAPDSRQKTEAHRQDLINKISSFKSDPSNANFDALYSDVKGVLNSYAKQPPSAASNMTGPYVTSLRASMYNLSDANSLAEQETDKVAKRGENTPANAQAINETTQNQGQAARSEITSALDNAEAFTKSLDTLRSKSPEEFQATMGNFTEQDLDLLKNQIKDLRASLASNSPVSQAQMSQLNQIWSSMNQINTQPNFQAAVKQNDQTNPEMLKLEREDIDQSLKAAQTELAAATTDEAKVAAQQKISTAEARLAGLQNVGNPPSAEAQAVIQAYNKAFSAEGQGTVQSAFSKVQTLVEEQSVTLAQLQEAESTLTSLMGDRSITVPQRAQLDQQRQVVRIAQEALQNGQPINLTEAQAPIFESVMSSLKSTSTPRTNTSTTNYQLPSLNLQNPGYGYSTTSGLFADYNYQLPLNLSPMSLSLSPSLSNYSTGTLYSGVFNTSLPDINLQTSATGDLVLAGSNTSNFLNPSAGFSTGIRMPSLNLNMGTPSSDASTVGQSVVRLPLETTGQSTASPAQIPSQQAAALTLRESLMNNASRLAEGSSESGQSAMTPENQARVTTLEKIANNRSLVASLSKEELDDSREYIARTIGQLRAGETVENIDELIDAYNALDKSAGSDAAASSVAAAFASLQANVPFGDVQNHLTTLQNDPTLRETFKQKTDQALAQNVTQENQRENAGKNTINTGAGTGTSALNGLAQQSGFVPGGEKTASLHFAQLDDAKFAQLDIPGRIAELDRQIAQASGGSAASQADSAVLTQMRLDRAQLAATVEYRAAYQTRMQSLDQGITRLENQLKTLTPPSETNSAARTALAAQIKEMDDIRKAVKSERELSVPEREAVARAEMLRVTGATISHLNQLNNSNNSPEFKAIYARYTELLRNGNFSLAQMNEVFEMIQTAASSGSPTFRLPNPPLNLRVTTVEDIPPATGSDGQIEVRSENVTLGQGNQNNIVLRAAAGAVAELENFQVHTRTARGVINMDVSTLAGGNGFTVAGPRGRQTTVEMSSNGQEFTITGPNGTSTFNATMLTTPGPMRDAALRRLSDPNSLPSQIVNRLASSGAISPELQAVFSSLQAGGEPATNATAQNAALTGASNSPGTTTLAPTTTGVVSQDSMFASSDWITNSGGASISDPTGSIPPRPMSELGPDADPPPTVAEAALYSVEQPQTLSEDDRRIALQNINETNQVIDDTRADLSETLKTINDNLASFNVAQAREFDDIFDNMMVGLALQAGIPPREIEQMAKNDPSLSKETLDAIEKANQLEAELDLAPMPSVSGDQLFGEWITETMGIIRNWDEATRQVVMAQIAKQMMDQIINTFYKDKQDESSGYHESQIANLRSARTATVQQDRQGRDVQSAENSQAIAAQSGGARSGDRSAAFSQAAKPQSVEEARQGLRDSITKARNGTPPLNITAQQEENIMNQFDVVIRAASTPGIEDDQSAALGLSSQLAGIQRP